MYEPASAKADSRQFAELTFLIELFDRKVQNLDDGRLVPSLTLEIAFERCGREEVTAGEKREVSLREKDKANRAGENSPLCNRSDSFETSPTMRWLHVFELHRERGQPVGDLRE